MEGMPIEQIRFRNLNADEIEVRRGRNVGKSGKVELLLYKTARSDYKLLTETVGVFWKKYYKAVNGMTVCGIAIKNRATGEWVEREDVGAEQNFEKEKSLFSDSFKRAGFMWGIGIALYSAPRIIVEPESDYTTYEVEEIGYDSNDRINLLKIVDDNGNLVFNMQDGKVLKIQEPDRVEVLRTVCGELKHAEGVDKDELLRFFNYYSKKADNFDSWNAKLVNRLWGKWCDRK